MYFYFRFLESWPMTNVNKTNRFHLVMRRLLHQGRIFSNSLLLLEAETLPPSFRRNALQEIRVSRIPNLVCLRTRIMLLQLREVTQMLQITLSVLITLGKFLREVRNSLRALRNRVLWLSRGRVRPMHSSVLSRPPREGDGRVFKLGNLFGLPWII